MFQIVFNELSAAEISQLPKKLQLELLAEFQILPEDLDKLDSKRFGVIERDNKKLYRYRAKEYRIYFERTTQWRNRRAGSLECKLDQAQLAVDRWIVRRGLGCTGRGPGRVGLGAPRQPRGRLGRLPPRRGVGPALHPARKGRRDVRLPAGRRRRRLRRDLDGHVTEVAQVRRLGPVPPGDLGAPGAGEERVPAHAGAADPGEPDAPTG